MRMGVIGLASLLPASLLGGWLAWGYAVERAQLSKLMAVVSKVNTAPVGPAPIASIARRLNLRFFERVISLTIDAGGRDMDLAHLAPLRHMQHLQFSNNNVTDAGLTHLSNLQDLRTLDLSGTNVTDQGLACLASLAKLQRIDVTGTSVKYARLLRHERTGLVVDGLPSPPLAAMARAPAFPTRAPRPRPRRANRPRKARPVPAYQGRIADLRSTALPATIRPPVRATFASGYDVLLGPPLFFDAQTRSATTMGPPDRLTRTMVPLPRSSRDIWLEPPMVALTDSDEVIANVVRKMNSWQSTDAGASSGGVQPGSVATAMASGPQLKQTTYERNGNGLSNAPAPRGINIRGAGLSAPSRLLDVRNTAFRMGRSSNATSDDDIRLFEDHRWLPPIRDVGRFDARIPTFNSRPWPYTAPTGAAGAAADYRFMRDGAAAANQ